MAHEGFIRTRVITACLLCVSSLTFGAEFFTETFNDYQTGISPCPLWMCGIDPSVTIATDETITVSGRSCRFSDPGGPMSGWISHPVDANSQVVLEYYMRSANQNYQGPQVILFDGENRDYSVVFSNGLDGGLEERIGLAGVDGWVDPNLLEYEADKWYYVVRVIDCNAGTGSFHIEQVDDPRNHSTFEIAPPSSMTGVDKVVISTSPDQACDGYIDELRLTWPPVRVIYVDDDAGGADTGLSWQDAYRFLQDALADANSNPGRIEIRVAQGTYKPDRSVAEPNGSGNRSASFFMQNHVALKGGYAGLGIPDPNLRDFEGFETILSGDLLGNDGPIQDHEATLNDPFRTDNSYHVVTARRVYVSASIDGFTISGGHADGEQENASCAGLWADYAGPRISNCLFHSNCAGWVGGALSIMELDLFAVVDNCTFIKNCAAHGGGVAYNGNNNKGVFRRCRFSANQAVFHGGGMSTEVANPMIVDCEFSNNTANWSGGGLWNGPRGQPEIIRCRFKDNLSRAQGEDFGGGGLIDEAFLGGAVVADCIFVNNRTTGTQYRNGRGGALFCRGANTTVNNCTFVDNAGRLGNAVAIGDYEHWDGYSIPGTLSVRNSILWNGGNEVWADANGTISIAYSTVSLTGRTPYPGPGNTQTNPRFLNAAEDDFRLLPESPCIDTGDPNFVASQDQTDAGGTARVLDGDENGSFIVDMGAYEFDPARPIIEMSRMQVDFYGIEGTNPPESQSLVISNAGGDVLEWIIEEDCSWLEVDPVSGNSEGEFNLVNLQVDTEELPEGEYECELAISSPTALNSPQTVRVMLTVVKTCMPQEPHYTLQGEEFMKYAAEGLNASCWCQPPFGQGYQCDGDTNGKDSGFPAAYRVYIKDLNLIVDNWRKKLGDPALDPCADVDHRDSGFPAHYRVFLGDLNTLVANWQKRDADLPGDCPRAE